FGPKRLEASAGSALARRNADGHYAANRSGATRTRTSVASSSMKFHRVSKTSRLAPLGTPSAHLWFSIRITCAILSPPVESLGGAGSLPDIAAAPDQPGRPGGLNESFDRAPDGVLDIVRCSMGTVVGECFLHSV